MNVKHCGGEPSLVSMSRLQVPRGHTASVTRLEMASEKSCNVSELEAGDNTTVHGHILDLSLCESVSPSFLTMITSRSAGQRGNLLMNATTS